MRWPEGENTTARGWSSSRTKAGSRRSMGSISKTPLSVATATRSPHRVAARSPPGGSHRVEAASRDVERHDLTLFGDREQEVRFGVEPDQPSQGGQLAPHGTRYFCEAGEPVGSQEPSFGGNANRQPRRAGAGDDRLANYLFRLLLR